MPRSTVFTFHFDATPSHRAYVSCCRQGHGRGREARGHERQARPRVWAEGKREEVLRYVGQDVRTTLDLATGCESCGASAGSPGAGRSLYDFGRGMAGGGGGSFVAVARHLLDGRAVAEGEVYGVDAYSTSIPCSIASFAPAAEIRMTMCPSLLGTISSTRMSTAICVRPAVVAGSHDFRITRPVDLDIHGPLPLLGEPQFSELQMHGVEPRRHGYRVADRFSAAVPSDITLDRRSWATPG